MRDHDGGEQRDVAGSAAPATEPAIAPATESATEPATEPSGRLLGRLFRDPFAWVVALWSLGGLVWLWAYRRTGYFELDEAGYVGMALRLASQRKPKGFLLVLTNEGNHGPLQALLAAPPQLLLRPDPRLVLVENVLLAAGTAVLVCWSTRRLSTHVAGTVAGTLMLLAPGVIEHSRLALTTTPSMFFGALAVYALIRSDGLERVPWATAAGAAVGAMTLARSMTIGFAPVLGVVALGWAFSRRTSVWIALRGAVAMGVAASVTAAWWWVIRWDDVSHYLFGGGSSATERVRDPVGKFVAHADEVAVNLGTLLPIVGIALLLALWPRRGSRAPVQTAVDLVIAALSGLAVAAIASGDAAARSDAMPWLLAGGVVLAMVRARRAARRSDRDDAVAADEGALAADDSHGRRSGEVPAAAAPPTVDLAVWPLGLGVLVGLAVLAASTAFGVGFVLPLIPWAIVAGVASARRVLTDRWWRWWAVVVVAVAVPVAAVTPQPGLQATLTWCGEDEPRAYCGIDSNADGAAWRTVSDRIADRVLTAVAAGREAGIEDPRAALTFRDATVNGNTVQLSMQWRHRTVVDVWSFLQGGAPVEDQIAAVREGADVVVVVPDRYEQPVLATDSPSPDELVAALTGSGFRPCDRFPTPGGDDVVVLVAPAMPDTACVPHGS